MSEYKSLFNNVLSKIRNIFLVGEFVKRSSKSEDSNIENIQVKTSYGRTIELNEAFPYGFITKAKKGKVIVFTNGGNFDSVEILPISSTQYAPKIEEGDVCIYAEGEAKIILHEDEIYLNGNDLGGLIKIKELKKELEKNNQILQALLNVISSSVISEAGNGAASSLQAAFKIALAGKTVGDFSNIENEKVKHG